MYDELNGRLTDVVDGVCPDREEITLADSAPDGVSSLVNCNSVFKASELIWNKITMGERANGQLAREITAALPIELSYEQNIALMQDFVRNHIVVMGVVVQEHGDERRRVGHKEPMPSADLAKELRSSRECRCNSPAINRICAKSWHSFRSLLTSALHLMNTRRFT